MPVQTDAQIEITAFDWVPDLARGLVRDLRPRWACEELGLPYRERLISAVDRPQWYFADQPWGQVPAMRDGWVKIFESGAQLFYLADRTGELLPHGGQERAEVLSWLFAAFNSVEPYMMELAEVVFFSAGEEWAEGRKPGLMDTIGKRLDPLQSHLDGREWLGEEFSIADIAMVTILRIPGESPLIADRPALSAYRARGERRPAFQRALEQQLAAFADQPPSPRMGE